MSLVEMHSALARLYVNDAFLESFCAEPATALAGYDLTPRETAALAGIDRDAVKKFASSLRHKNFGRFEHAYRLLLALDASVFHKYYLRFYELRPIQPYEAFHGPILELGCFLERSFADNPELPPYAADLARYQRLFFQARFEPRERSVSRTEASARGVLDIRTCLSIAPGVRIVWFGYDMRALEQALRKDETPQNVKSEECPVVFQSLGRLGRARKFQVSAMTVQLLSLCTGAVDLGEVAAGLESDREAVLEAADKLRGLGLLEEVASR